MKPSPNTPKSQPQQPRIWTTLDLLAWTKAFFEKKGIENPRLESELLLAEALGCARLRLYTDFENAVPADKLAAFREFVRRRADNREPLQYIVGHTQFIGLKIKVTPAVLIPRPETEILAVWAADRAKEVVSGARVLDLCTGTGCVALHIASKLPDASVWATDISADALALALENAQISKLESRVRFSQGDLFAALVEQTQFDVITANPPYVDPAARENLQPEVRDHEPSMALFAADNGLAVSRRIIAECIPWLKPGGWLGLEFGIEQQESLAAAARATGAFRDVLIEKDGAKIPRFLHARKA